MKQLRRFNRQHELDKRLVSALSGRRAPTRKQIRHLPKVLSPREKSTAGILTLIMLVALGVMGGNAYYGLTDAVPQRGGEFAEGLIGTPRFINPILAQTNDVDLDMTRLVFSGLVRYDGNGQLSPDLAERYEISEDQLTYTFFLKSNVTWHDGHPFTADDVVFTIASIQDPDFQSPIGRSFRGITAEKIDDHTVKFTLKETFAPFLSLLTVGILPEHLWYNIPPANATLTELNKKPIGTGPWQFDNFKRDASGSIKSYTLTPYAGYYGATPNFDQVTFRFYGDATTAIEALKNKQVRSIAYLPADNIEDIASYRTLTYERLEQPQYVALFFNQTKNDLLKADYVRQALALATDKQHLITEIFHGNARAIDAPVLPGIEAGELTRYDHQPEAAAALLEKNDWKLVSTTTPDGLSEQVRYKGKYELAVSLTVVDQPTSIAVAEALKKSWASIGVKTTIVIVERGKALTETVNNRGYEILLFGHNVGADPDPFAFWHSSQISYPGLNLAGFNNKASDTLLEEARMTADWSKRQEKYQQFLAHVTKGTPAIFLYSPYYLYPHDRQIKGMSQVSIASPADRLLQLGQWYTKTNRVWR